MSLPGIFAGKCSATGTPRREAVSISYHLFAVRRAKGRVSIGPTFNNEELPMKLRSMLVILGVVLPAAAQANDFPTQGRVEYVLECITANGGKQEFLYKCSCAVDNLAKSLKYADYVELSTAKRNQSLGGERGAVFRDPAEVKGMAKKLNTLEAAANQACLIK